MLSGAVIAGSPAPSCAVWCMDEADLGMLPVVAAAGKQHVAQIPHMFSV